MDNFYHGVHIHPDRTELTIKDPQIIYNLIYEHIMREGRIIEYILREELGL